MSRVGDSQNPLLSGSDLSTIIERPVGPSGMTDNGTLFGCNVFFFCFISVTAFA